MKKHLYTLLILVPLLSIALSACKTRNMKCNQPLNENEKIVINDVQPGKRPLAGPQTLRPIVFYMTKGDYQNLVPITLSADKSEVVAYPACSDLKNGNGYMKPIALGNGYYYDQRGVGPNTAFLKLTYEEYCNLPQQPSLKELMQYVKDKDPFLFLAVGDRAQLPNESVEAYTNYCKKGFPNAHVIIDRRTR